MLVGCQRQLIKMLSPKPGPFDHGLPAVFESCMSRWIPMADPAIIVS